MFNLNSTSPKSTCFTEPTPSNTITNTKPKLDIGLGSHKKPVLTPELENPNPLPLLSLILLGGAGSSMPAVHVGS